MNIKPFKNIEEVKALIGTGRRVVGHKRPPNGVGSNENNLTVLAIGVNSVFVSNEDGREFTIGRYYILNYYGVEVPDEYVYVNVYKTNTRLYAQSVCPSREIADNRCMDDRVGCIKIKLEERFDD